MTPAQKRVGAVLLFIGLGLFGGTAIWRTQIQKALQSRLDVGARKALARASAERDESVDLVLKDDPDFSLVLFEDFAYALYAESLRVRHDPRARAGLGPYWTKAAMDDLAARPSQGGRVSAVVVNSLALRRAYVNLGHLCVDYSFETNLHLQLDTLPPRAFTQSVEETWTFRRSLGAKTRPWTGVRKLGCPNCGAPLGTGDDVRCPSCGETYGEGRFDWQVASVALNHLDEMPSTLTGTTEEVGTDAPTRFTPSVRHDLEALLTEDPGLSRASVEARLRLIFTTLQSTWSAQELRPLRPFVSDRQYDYLQYWIDAYREQGLRNLMESPRLEKFTYARVERDRHYDSLTLRIWGSGCDYTVATKTGSVVGGSRTTPRRYSEYWTLIKSAKAHGTPRLDHNCPGCGVALQVNMGGECEHCGAHMTSGEFDWVLSKIEQDESYRG
jgi:hypothetical protein